MCTLYRRAKPIYRRILPDYPFFKLGFQPGKPLAALDAADRDPGAPFRRNRDIRRAQLAAIAGKLFGSSRFVDKVYRLIRKEAVAYIPFRKLHGGSQCAVGNTYPVEALVFFPQAEKHLNTAFGCRLLNIDPLHTPFQCFIPADAFCKFARGGSADQA